MATSLPNQQCLRLTTSTLRWSLQQSHPCSLRPKLLEHACKPRLGSWLHAHSVPVVPCWTGQAGLMSAWIPFLFSYATLVDMADAKPKTTAELNKLASVSVDQSIPIRLYFRSADLLIKQARIYRSEGDLEQAYVLYMKYTKYATNIGTSFKEKYLWCWWILGIKPRTHRAAKTRRIQECRE